MTEGIIQKVFNNYLSRIDNMPWDKRDLRDLQQELIEEVNKLKWDYCTNPKRPHAYSVEVKKLIGDSP